MRSNIFREAKLSIYIFALIIFACIMFYLFASIFISMGYEGLKKSNAAITSTDYSTPVVVVDPGHGGEDPGALDNGLIEKHLNLEISRQLADFLSSFGYNTVLTREEDVLLYGGSESSTKKQQDLNSRVEIANSYSDSLFVSIHMNKFPAEYCKGLQTFYSNNNPNSSILAESIQTNSVSLQTYNKRKIKDGTENIYVLSKLNMPAVLVECGFISNMEEASLLTEENYKTALAFSIYCGISTYLENNNEARIHLQ